MRERESVKRERPCALLGCVIASVCIILNKGREEERSAFFLLTANGKGGGGGPQDKIMSNMLNIFRGRYFVVHIYKQT